MYTSKLPSFLLPDGVTGVLSSNVEPARIAMELSALRYEYVKFFVRAKKSESTKQMALDFIEYAKAAIGQNMHVLLEWLMDEEPKPLPCRCQEVPLYCWYDVTYAMWEATEAFVDRSKFRDELLYPLRRKIADFKKFYVASSQQIVTSLDKEIPAQMRFPEDVTPIQSVNDEPGLPF